MPAKGKNMKNGKKLHKAKKIGKVKPLTTGVDPLNPQPLPPLKNF